MDVTGPFTKLDKSDADYMRNTVADVSSAASINAGRFSAATAALAMVPSPYSAGFSAAAHAATIAGFAADAIALGVAAVGGYASRAHMLKIKPFDNSYKKARKSYEENDDKQDKKR